MQFKLSVSIWEIVDRFELFKIEINVNKHIADTEKILKNLKTGV